jgi:chromosome partitioning protein
VQVISFMNMKGGVGKTTLAVNVAYALAHQYDKKVLVVDADPQFNATQYLVHDAAYFAHFDNEKKGWLRHIFVPKQEGKVSTISGLAKPTNKSKIALDDCTIEIFQGGWKKNGRLDLIPSHLSIIDVNTPPQSENRLKIYLNEKASHYDYVIIDCPPTISFFTTAAILASHKYVVPIKPDPLSVIGLKHIESLTHDAGMKLEQVGLVFTMVTGQIPQAMRDVMARLRTQRKGAIFKDSMSHATGVAKSVVAHQPVFLYKEASAKSKMQVVDITKEFLQRTSS